MTNSTATVSPSMPPWLAGAIEQHEEQQLNETARQIMNVRDVAEKINAQLEKLGIEPISPARALVEQGRVEAAVLVSADYDRGTYEVRALWDERSQQIELHTADWEARRPTFGRVRLLNSIADVAAARHETPKFPAPARDLRAEALRAIDSLNLDRLNDHQVEAVVTAINGLTAAMLYVGESNLRSNDRP